MERVEGGIRIILVGSSSTYLVLLACAGHEGQEPSLPKMRAGSLKAALEIGIWGGRFQ